MPWAQQHDLQASGTAGKGGCGAGAMCPGKGPQGASRPDCYLNSQSQKIGGTQNFE